MWMIRNLYVWLSPSHACPRKLQENMAVDTDASTSASTEADKSCFCAFCLCVHGRVLDVAYKVWLLILPLLPYTRMQLLKRMLPLTRLSPSIDRLQLHEHPLAVASSSRETFAAVWRSWSNKRKQRRRSRKGGACKAHAPSICWATVLYFVPTALAFYHQSATRTVLRKVLH